MIPVYIEGCFAVLHPAPGTHGVVICNTLGDEALCCYRPLVFLAERFAASGCPTLRVEYYGAGDSAGEDHEPNRFQAWLAGIAAGVRWLRERCGVDAVTLVGTRIGALLAATAACRMNGVAAMILLAPPANGRRFIREMILRANSTAETWQTGTPVESDGWFEAYGLRIDVATRNALERLDISRLPRTPAPVALVVSESLQAAQLVAGGLQKIGTGTEIFPVEGFAAMLRDPYENAVPHAAFARAVEWHASIITQRPVSTAATPADAQAVLRLGHASEIPVFFGPAKGLFGILCQPLQPNDEAPPVLITNAGANARSGNSRGAVTTARWLARHGIASLRMDGAGIGDSAIDTGERGQPYAAEGDRDLAAGIDELSRRHRGPLVLLGICSGAFHALRATCREPRIRGLMLLNLQKFVWHEGESLSVVQRSTVRTTRYYLQNVTNRAVWRRILMGNVSIVRIARALAGRAARRAATVVDPMLAWLRGVETPAGYVRRQVRELRQRGVPVLFVLSGNDPGLDEIAAYFGANGRQLRQQPNVMFRLLEGADHTLSSQWARAAMLGLIADFLRERCGMQIEAGEPAKIAMPAAEAENSAADRATSWSLAARAALPGGSAVS